MAIDPITKIHDGIWTMLEASSAFTSAVPARNRIKFTGGHYRPSKEVLSQSDYPQVAVLYLGPKPLSERATEVEYIRTMWSIEVLGGIDQQLGDTDGSGTLSIDWIIYEAQTYWRTYLAPLTYKSEQFMKCWRMVDGEAELVSRKANRGIEGWRTSFVAYADIWLETALLQT